MSITVTEKPNSRSRSGGTTTLYYTASGTSDHEAVEAALLTETPTFMNGLPREADVTIEPEWADTVTDDGKWDCEVRYSPQGSAGTTAPPETGDSVFNFEIGGGTQHITQAIQTVTQVAAEGCEVVDFKGAIGVAGNGENIEVQGVDINAPAYSFSEIHYIPDSTVTPEYRKKLAMLASKKPINAATFRGFNAHEVRFDGASGSKRGEGDWEMTFKFSVSLNSNINLATLPTFYKRGWDYVWICYATKKSINRYVAVPIQATVVKVYNDGDFTDLGIGA